MPPSTGKHKGLQKHTTSSFYLTTRVLSEPWLRVEEVQMTLISAELIGVVFDTAEQNASKMPEGDDRNIMQTFSYESS